jgi:hypothetical protein
LYSCRHALLWPAGHSSVSHVPRSVHTKHIKNIEFSDGQKAKYTLPIGTQQRKLLKTNAAIWYITSVDQTI